MNKSNKYSIGIVTPSFQQGQFIEQTIASVLNQKYPSLHYVVMDGGSTDQTVQILQSYGKQLTFVSKKDNGQTDAINKGMNLLIKDGVPDIVAYINSDDYYLPDAFKIVSDQFASHPEAMWLVGDAVIVNETGKEIQGAVRLYKRLLRSLMCWPLLLVLNPIPQPAVFIRGEVLEKLGEFDETLRFTMDYEYWLRLFKVYGAPIHVSKALAAFRIHGTSKGSTQYPAQFKEQYAVAARFTNNPLVLGLHRLHNQLTLWIYQHLK